MSGNPYNLKPSISVLKKLGPVDIQKPRFSVGLTHDSNLGGQELGSAISAFSQSFSADLAMRSSPEWDERFTSGLGYRPSIVRFFEYPTLNTFDHYAFITMGLVIQKMKLSYAGTLVRATRPTFLTGARSLSTQIGQVVEIAYELNPKLSFRLSPRFNISKQEQALIEELGGGSSSGTTSMSLLSRVDYSLSDKITATANLGFTSTKQDTAVIVTEQVGGNRTSIASGFGLTYSKSEKLRVTIGAGVAFNSNGDSYESPPDNSYELSVVYRPTHSNELTASIGSSTLIGQSGLGLTTKNDYIRALFKKNLIRRTTISAAMEISTAVFDSESAFAAAIGTTERTIYSLVSTTPIGKSTSVQLSYSIQSAKTSSALLQQANTTSSISVSYSF